MSQASYWCSCVLGRTRTRPDWRPAAARYDQRIGVDDMRIGLHSVDGAHGGIAARTSAHFSWWPISGADGIWQVEKDQASATRRPGKKRDLIDGLPYRSRPYDASNDSYNPGTVVTECGNELVGSGEGF